MNTRLRELLVFMAAVLPMIVQWVLKAIVWPRPFWIHFHDPESIFFYQGLHLLRGEVPWNVDHPGTPVQLASAAISGITGATTPLRYERFLAAAHVTVLLFVIAGAALLLRTVLRDVPVPLRLAGVWTWLLAPVALERIDVWAPEETFFLIGALALAMLWRYERRPSVMAAVVLGMVAGVAIAIKIVMIGFGVAVVAAVLAQRRIRDASWTALGVVMGFVLATLPIATRWNVMVSRILLLTLDPDWSELEWPAVLAGAKGWFLWVALVVVLALPRLRKLDPVLVFGVVAIAVTVAGGLRSPSYRHLLPLAVGVVAMVSTIRVRPAFTALVFVLAAALLAKSMGDDFSAHRARIASGLAAHDALHALLPQGAPVLWSWRAPEPSFALRVMAEDPRDHAVIARLFPGDGLYDVWRNRVHPPLAGEWRFLVIRKRDLPRFPLPVGPLRGEVEDMIVVSRR